MYKLCFFVPDAHVEAVKQAVFATGAGRIGNYEACCWQVLGQGQFRPLSGSQPFIGETGVVQQVAEWKVAPSNWSRPGMWGIMGLLRPPMPETSTGASNWRPSSACTHQS